jgi:hypothetical protein
MRLRHPPCSFPVVSVPLLTLLGALLCLNAGCPPGGRLGFDPFVEIRDADSALARINANLRRINDKLECQAVVSFRFRDSDGRQRRFVNHDAVLRFEAPRCLRFDVKGLAGVIAQFGSNDERYWIWVEPELNTLWWGDWEMVDTVDQTLMPVPPQRLLDGLLWRELPATLDDAPPELRRGGPAPKLVYTRYDGTRARELALGPNGLPTEIIDRDADGVLVMHAKLADYQRIGERGPLIPRRYVVEWPQSEGHMELRINAAKFRPTLPDWFCAFPERWTGRVEQLDR